MGIGIQNGISSARKKLTMLTRFVTRVFPGVEKELKRWQEVVSTAGDPELRQQGLASIEKKKFHCLGGSVYTLMEGAHQDTLSFIVALQTISDYLDNLCDRAGCLDMAAFRRLHLAFTDALEPENTHSAQLTGIPQISTEEDKPDEDKRGVVTSSAQASAAHRATIDALEPENTHSAQLTRILHLASADGDKQAVVTSGTRASAAHRATADALEPDGSTDGSAEGGIGDYYSLYPHQDDAGYLKSLVEECRNIIRRLPSYQLVQEDVLRLASLYCDLQTYKHTHIPLREGYLERWFAEHATKVPELDWWEFAAATGSTLGIFALIAAAGQPNLDSETARRITDGYFPWICGLHILLDYFIDQEEDLLEGDLNFVSYYENREHCIERLVLFLEHALDQAARMPDPLFHTTVVQGLPAFYLSDPKVGAQGLEEDAMTILEAAGEETVRMYRVCRSLRRRGKI
ncbi:conserved hypothetical protein [Syntrophaceticus schinkii]|uniref:Tetraprenyl-beta-curcumene synthase n=1 Tax=Syntrophaceticus schinkii TaxID=499207 RepID=A0A0B7MBD5_9FIRM|nr:conserved hypothetical protein [Syntrophaceticus schinkii]